MTYVDLNPVRAGLAESPETSEFTSVYDRIVARQANEALARVSDEGVAPSTAAQLQKLSRAREESHRADWLKSLDGDPQERPFVDVDLDKYLELMDWTGRCLKEGKQGSIPSELLPVMSRLTLDTDHWVENVRRFGGLYYRMAGRAEQLKEAAKRCGQRWFNRQRQETSLFADESPTMTSG